MLSQKNTLLLLVIFCILSCQTPGKIEYTFLISNVNIIDYESGSIRYGTDIGIQKDRIVYLGDHDQSLKSIASNSIDATGKFAIPGLWDNHIHLRGGENLIKANKEFLSLFIANGITGVRDAGGDLSKEVIIWKNAIAKGHLTGPVIFTSGPKIDGPEATWAGSIEIKDPSFVARALDSLESLNVDFVKLYDSKISREVYLKVLREARSRNLITSGHMPFSVLLSENIKYGIGSIEHLYYVLKGCSKNELEITKKIRNNEIGFWDSFQALMDSYDNKTATRNFKLMRTYNTYVTPTLHIGNVLSNLKTERPDYGEYLQFIDSTLVKTYKSRIERALRASEESHQVRLKLQEKFKALTLELQNAGVPLLAGSDCGAYNSFIYPGISLHQELEAMVTSGLTPLEALKASTFNGARFLKQDSLYGTISINKMADILVLDKNPLANIRHTQQINSVVIKGKLYTKSKLDSIKNLTKN